MEKQITRKPEGWFYIAWISVGLMSAYLTIFISLELVSLIEGFIGEHFVMGGLPRMGGLSTYVLLPLLGITSGIYQTLLLRNYIHRISWWAGATAIGWVLPILSIRLIYEIRATNPDPYSKGYLLLWTLLIGFWTGICQWLILRKRIRYAIIWFMVNIIAWSIIGLITSNIQTNIWQALMSLIFYGTLTAATWWLLLDKLRRKNYSEEVNATEPA